KDIAKRGKTSTGWFYGFKLHAVFNRLGELVTFHLSTGNTDDRQALKQMAKQLSGTLVGDKGYISKDLA
ncbi:transposase, partial [Conchiformibius steedae]